LKLVVKLYMHKAIEAIREILTHLEGLMG